MAEAVQRLALARIERDIAAAQAGEAAPAEDAEAKGRRDDPVAAVERIGRTVRLSLALAARLDSDEPVRRTRVRADAKAEREAQADASERDRKAREHDELVEAAVREDMVFEVVEATLKAAGLDREAVQDRVEQIQERMAEAEGEWEYDYVRRPVGAVAAKICEDLDLKPDWSLWAGEDWAIEEAATGAEGSPYGRGGAFVEPEGDVGPDEPPEVALPEAVAAEGSSP